MITPASCSGQAHCPAFVYIDMLLINRTWCPQWSCSTVLINNIRASQPASQPVSQTDSQTDSQSVNMEFNSTAFFLSSLFFLHISARPVFNILISCNDGKVGAENKYNVKGKSNSEV